MNRTKLLIAAVLVAASPTALAAQPSMEKMLLIAAVVFPIGFIFWLLKGRN